MSLGEALVCPPTPPHLPPPTPSLGPRVEPPCRVESGWERNALGCGAAPSVEDRRHNSHSMDSTDPYLHLSKYASQVPCVFPAYCARLEASTFCFDSIVERVCFMAFVCSRAPSRWQTLTTDSVIPAVTLPSSLQQSARNWCQLKRNVRPMQKSGDRGCAGQARSEVGTLIALM